MITDPHEALAEQNQVVAALVGLAALGRAVRALAAGARHPTPRAADRSRACGSATCPARCPARRAPSYPRRSASAKPSCGCSPHTRCT